MPMKVAELRELIREVRGIALHDPIEQPLRDCILLICNEAERRWVLPSPRDKAAYNSYMRVYMKSYRARRKAKLALASDPK